MTHLLTVLLADGLVVIVALVGAWALITKVPKSLKLESYSRVLMAGLTSYLAAKLIAVVYQPEALRPFQEMGVKAGAAYLPNPGFPSDHVLFCTAITLAVYFETRSKGLGVVLGILTLLVGVGRVAALVHTPLDVAGGLVIGLFGALWYLQRPSRTTYANHAATSTGKNFNKQV